MAIANTILLTALYAVRCTELKYQDI